MGDGTVSGPHFSLVVAPVLAAFTLPTVALIVTIQPQPHLGNIIVALFVASTGLLLASFQFAVGRLFRDTTGWGAFRAFLAGFGLVLLGAGLCLLVLSWGEAKPKAPPPYAGSREVLYAGLIVLAAGIIIPISINLWLYAERIVLRSIRRDVAKRIRALRWIYPLSHQERIEEHADERKRKYRSFNRLAEDVGQEFSKESDERVFQLKRIQAYPSASDVNYVLECICYSHSAVEKDQALRAAIRVIPELGDRDSARLAAVAQLLSLLDG